MLQVYPVVARFPQTGGEYKTIEIRLKVKVVDKDLQDNSTQNDVHSDTLRICQDVLNEINQHPFYIHSNATLIGDIEMTQMNEVFDDYLVGWEFDLTMRLKNMNNFCGIPIAEMPGYSAAGPVDSDFSISWGYLTCETITGCTNLTNFITNYINDNPGILNTTVLNGTNTFTGGTALHPTINVTGGTFNSINVTGGTISSGGTDLYSIFVTAAGASATTVTAGSNIAVSNAGLNYTISVSGSPIFNSITSSGASSFTTLSASSFISGSTNIATVINNAATRVQPGLNTYTGGTAALPTVNISAATLSSLSATTISGGTYYSGSTPLSTIITQIVTGSSTNTSVGNGLNTYTGGTATVPNVNVSALTINFISVSGNSQFSNTTATLFSGGTISGGTYYSGSTPLYSVINNMITGVTSIRVQNGLNTYTGGTADLPRVNISAATLDNLTVSGNTILSPTSASSLVIISTGTTPSFRDNNGNVIESATTASNIVGGIGNRILAGLSNVQIIGGYNITGTTSNTVYISNLSANTLYVANFPCDLSFAISDETTQITTGTNKVTIYAPYAFTLTETQASLSQSGSAISTFNIKKNGSTIYTTKMTIDANEFSTGTAATPPVITGTSISKYDKLTVDIDTTGTGAAGAKIYLIGTRTI